MECFGEGGLQTVEGWQGQWFAAIRALTATPVDAAAYLDRRLRFTTAVASALSHTAPELDPLLYGVWLEGHPGPIYIGQTLEGRRRLWDLPIGESHHLANSFPPEIWSRVVVVYWGYLLDRRPELAQRLAADLLPLALREPTKPVIGLGLEYLLQRRYQPLFNCRKKRRDGGWREVVWEASGSVGARAAPHLSQLLDVVVTVWEALAATPASKDVTFELPGGRVVFPGVLSRAPSDAKPDAVAVGGGM